jgi:putative membrane protein
MTDLPLLHATWGAWPLFAPLWILAWIIVIATLVRVFFRRGIWCGPGRWVPRDADAILAERFARGEIDRDEYRSRLETLRQ